MGVGRIKQNGRTRDIVVFLLFFPFFIPHSVVLLQQFSVIWSYFYDVVAVFRCLVGAIAIFLFVVKRIKPSLLTIFVMLYEVSIFFACMVNGTLTFRFSITNCMLYIGFACLIQIYERKKQDELLDSLITFFSVMSWLGALSILLFPDGFNHAEMKNQAIYFLGSKNNSFFYFMMYIFLKVYRQESKVKRIKASLLCECLIFIGCTLITDSMNGTLMLLIILTYLWFRRSNVSLKIVFSPKIIFYEVVAMAALIPAVATGKMQWFFDLIGRESNFSMRTYIWQSAIELFVQKPWFGNGKDGDVIMYKGQTQAHNIYIDYAAKYGIITLLIFLLMMFCMAMIMVKAKNCRLKQTCAMFYVVHFVHALFDSVTMPFTILLLYYCYLLTQERNVLRNECLSLDKVS